MLEPWMPSSHFHYVVWSSSSSSWISTVQKFKLKELKNSCVFVKRHKTQVQIIEEFIGIELKFNLNFCAQRMEHQGFTDTKPPYWCTDWIGYIMNKIPDVRLKKFHSMWPKFWPRSLHGKRYKRFDSNLKFQSDLK